MAIAIGGDGSGILDSSLPILGRKDKLHAAEVGHGEEVFVNASNGNLVIQHQDAFLPSLGQDYRLTRTYNSRGDGTVNSTGKWSLSTSVRLEVVYLMPHRVFELRMGDGSLLEFFYDSDRGLWVSTDGEGAYQTLTEISNSWDLYEARYKITREDGTALIFDFFGTLLSSVDPNGVRMDFVYDHHTLLLKRVLDDQGHVIDYHYDPETWQLEKITDETGTKLVDYEFDPWGKLLSVTDRMGHVTRYEYHPQGMLTKVILPSEQTVNGKHETHANREIDIEYQMLDWRQADRWVSYGVTKITDAEGGVTTFDYEFDVNHVDSNPRLVRGRPNSQLRPNACTQPVVIETGGMTRVVDARGNARATSNEQKHVEWRVENGFYAQYDPSNTDTSFLGQVEFIRDRHSLNYKYRDDGYLTEVEDQSGHVTRYTYDEDDNLTSVVDRNGWAVTHSNDSYYRDLRESLGYSPSLSMLSAEDAENLEALYTRSFTYDSRGNRLTNEDHEHHVTSMTYTDFNAVSSITTAEGHEIATSDAEHVQDNRVRLGFSRLASDLTDAEKSELREIYTTRYEYDANQNLILQTDPGGDLIQFEYDEFGNRTRQIVFLDSSVLDPDLAENADKVQITTYHYDAFGNNTLEVDGEGNQTFSEYDHFGNLTRMIDPKGGVTTFAYDSDNRLVSITNPEGQTTISAYDSVGNKISMTDAAGHVITQIFDRTNLLLTTLNPSDNDPDQDRVTEKRYDVVGNRTRMTDAAGNQTLYTFDDRNQLVLVTTSEVKSEDGNPTTHETSFGYDAEAALIRTTDRRGFETDVIRTPKGLVHRETDPTGHITEIDYDANRNIVRLTEGLELASWSDRKITTYRYDGDGELIQQVTPLGNARAFSNEDEYQEWRVSEGYYEEWNPATSPTSELHEIIGFHSEKITYDAPGNLESVTNDIGSTTRYVYDLANRRVTEILPETDQPISGGKVTPQRSFSYDANGNQVSVVDENGAETRYHFDADNKLVLIIDPNGINTVFEHDSREYTTRMMIGVDAHLDIHGDVVVDSTDEAQVTSYEYDEFGQLVSRTDGLGNALADSDLTYYKQLRVKNGYAADQSQLSDADRKALRELYTEHYRFDLNGNRVAIVNTSDEVTEFEFDALDRLVRETLPQVEVINPHTRIPELVTPTTTMLYDGEGNIASRIDSLGRETSFEYDELGRPISTRDALDVLDTKVYDAFGRLVKETLGSNQGSEKRETTQTWDLNDRLVAVKSPMGFVRKTEYDPIQNKIVEIDELGNKTHEWMDARGRTIKSVDPRGFETQYEFDGAGNKIAILDSRGSKIGFEFDPGNRRIAMVDREGRETRYEYDQRNNQIKETTGFGSAGSGSQGAEVTTYEYDADNQLVAVIDAENHRQTFEYDRSYNVTHYTDKNGNSITTEFDALEREIKVTDPKGNVKTIGYDAVGNSLLMVDLSGRTTSVTYDARDRRIVEKNDDGVETHYAYDHADNQISVTTAANISGMARKLTYQYDRDDRLVATVSALGNYLADSTKRLVDKNAILDSHKTRFKYNADGNIRFVIDPLGNKAEYQHDDTQNIVYVRDPAGGVETFEYDGNGNRIVKTDARGNKTLDYFNDDDQMVLSIDPLGYATSHTYDANGNLATRTLHATAVIDDPDRNDPMASVIVHADDQVTSYFYDALNQLVRVVDALGGETEYQFDPAGNVVAEIDPNGHKTSFVYDQLNRVIQRTVPIGNELAAAADPEHRQAIINDYSEYFEYDPIGNQTKKTDLNGHINTYAYGVHNRLLSRTDAIGNDEAMAPGLTPDEITVVLADHTVVFTYDSVGNQLTEADQDGRLTTFTYDRDDRELTKETGSGSTRHYTYDAIGNRITEKDPNGNINTFDYDEKGRLLSRKDPIAGSSLRILTYDDADNITSETDEAGRTITMGYDSRNLLVSRTNPYGNALAESDGASYVQERKDLGFTDGSGNGKLAAELTESEKEDLRELHTEHYRYDAFKNRIETIDANDNVTSVGYDALNRRVTETTALGNALSKEASTEAERQTILSEHTKTTDYDLVGNITGETDALGNTVSRAYDANDRVVAELTAEGHLERYEYDQVGNLVLKREYVAEYHLQPDGSIPVPDGADLSRDTIYEYDENDRLISETDPRGLATLYEYDGAGNRTQTTHGVDSADTSGRRALSRENPTFYEYLDSDGRVYQREDVSGLVTHFSYDNAGNVITRLVAYETANERKTTYEYDANHRITRETDPVGNALVESDNDLYRAMRRDLGFEDGGRGKLVADLTASEIEILKNWYSTEYTYTEADQLATRTRSPGTASERVENFDWNANGKIAMQTNGKNETISFFYDGNENLIKTIAAEGTVSERIDLYEYDVNNNLIAETDGDGGRTEYTYDAENKKTETIQAAGTENQRRTLFKYDSDDRVSRVTTPVGSARTYSNESTYVTWRTSKGFYPTYSEAVSSAQVEAIINAHSTTYEYDSNGNRETITDANGSVTKNTFDANGWILTNTVDVNGAKGGIKTENTYNEYGEIIQTKKSFGDGSDLRVNTYEYDSMGRQTLMTDGSGYSTQFTYDVFGNNTKIEHGLYLVSSDDASYDQGKKDLTFVQSTTMEYDANDRLVFTTDGAGNHVEKTWDSRGNNLTLLTGIAGSSSTDPDHQSTVSFQYDLADRVVEKTTGTGGVVQTSYDDVGNQIEIQVLQSGTEATGDAKWSSTTYSYNDRGRVTASVDPLGIRTEHVYDETGNLLLLREAVGTPSERSSGFEYDLDGNISATIDAIGIVDGYKTSYVRDAVGNILSETDGGGHTSYFYYDGANRQIASVDPELFFRETSYDSEGNAIERKVYMQKVASVPTDGSLPSPVDSIDVQTETASFNGANKRVQTVTEDGTVTTYAFDSAGKMRSQTKNPNTQSDARARTEDLTPRTISWTWDASGRLTSFVNLDGTTETYSYDAANNRISESVSNSAVLATGASDKTRSTSYTYDLDNRVLSQTDGTRIQAFGYDNLGNVISKTDDGLTSSSQFDLSNQLISTTNPEGETTSYAYDRFGNLTSVTNAKGQVTEIEYDNLDREIETRSSTVTIYTIEGGEQNLKATTRNVYDRVGNLVSTESPNGVATSGDSSDFTITRWFNGNGKLIAELNGDFALRTFEYDAQGMVTETKLYQDPISPTGDPRSQESPPSGSSEFSETLTQYDLAGNAVKTTYSAIEVTALTNTSGSNPTAATSVQTPSDEALYDAWGNLVSSIDRNGDKVYAYYDVLDRQVMTVDDDGYVVQSAYDMLGNLVLQMKHEDAISDMSTLTPSTKPSAPSGTVHLVEREYDENNRLIFETSPTVGTSGSGTRVTTEFNYDNRGNLTAKVTNFAESDGLVGSYEFYYFDDANREVAIVTNNRVLNVKEYDEIGNISALYRYIDVIPASIDLQGASLSDLLGSVNENDVNNQKISFEYNTLGLVSKQTDHMGSGADDDIVTIFEYDPNGNLTRKTLDPSGNSIVTENAYNAANVITQTITPNGGYSYVQYNTANQKIQSWIGGAPGLQAPLASNVSTVVSNGSSPNVTINWDVSGDGVTSWVAWDENSHESISAGSPPSSAPSVPGVYGNATAAVGTGSGQAVTVTMPATADDVYFRVVTKDNAGNLAWTSERKVSIPDRVESLDVREVSGDFQVTAQFTGSVTSPKVTSGGPSFSMSHQGGNLWSGTVTGLADPINANLQIEWMDSGVSYATNAQAFLAAPGTHEPLGSDGWVTWPIPTEGGNPVGSQELVVFDGIPVTDSSRYLIDGSRSSFQFDPQIASGSTKIYDIFYGDQSTQDHSMTVSYADTQVSNWSLVSYLDEDGTTVVPEEDAEKTKWNKTWVSNNDSLIEATVTTTLTASEAAAINGNVKLAYRLAQGGNDFSNTVAMSGTTTAAKIVSLAVNQTYDLKIYYEDSNGDEVIVEWVRISTPEESASVFAGSVVVSGTSTPGLEVRTISVGSDESYSGKSFTVHARENAGTIGSSSGGIVSITKGVFTGAIAADQMQTSLPLSATSGSEAGNLSSNGLDSLSYYTYIEYDKLGQKIATNEDSGLWRTFGVDAMGNIVETKMYGTRAAEASSLSSIDTYHAYDGRDNEIAEWGPSVSGTRAVTRKTWNYNKQLATETKPGAQVDLEYEYDGVGNLTRESYSGAGVDVGSVNITTIRSLVYDVFGNIVSETDGNGNNRISVYGAPNNSDPTKRGRLISHYVNGLKDEEIEHTYDAFGRCTTTTDGREKTLTRTWDQHDRLTQFVDAGGGTTKYEYDKSDRHIWTKDPNGNFFGQAYDEVGRVTNEYSFREKKGILSIGTAPSSFQTAKEAVSNNSPMLVEKKTSYDVFNNKISETDPMGRQTIYTYGAFGRMLTQSEPGPKTTTYTYDRFGNRTNQISNLGQNIAKVYDNTGRVTQIDDVAVIGDTLGSSGLRTVYTYDIAGRRTGEVLERRDTGADFSELTYTYYDNGWLKNWTDLTSTDTTLNYEYDKSGNKTKISGSNTNHVYAYDAANRVVSFVDGTATRSYTYDDSGNRKSSTDSGGVTNYSYDDNNRVTTATGANTIVWAYDNAGNVTGISQGGESTTHTYDTNNLSYITRTLGGGDDGDGDDLTMSYFDLSGRLLSTFVQDASDSDDVKAYTFTHNYNNEGLLLSVSGGGSGDVSGTSYSAYDSNRRLRYIDLAQTDDQESKQEKHFAYNADGKIFRRYHDTGEEDDGSGQVTKTRFIYANGNPIGEYKEGAKGSPTLDQGEYAELKQISEDFPGLAVQDHVVERGESLRSIAMDRYGNQSLWFVLAEANGIVGDSPISAGTRLTVPNTVENGRMTHDSHAVYNEGEIVGSKIPGLKSPPPPKKNSCEVIAAIILIVVVAIVAIIVTVVTVGAAAPAAAAALGFTVGSVGAILVGVAVGAVIGAAVAFAASALTQGILIGFGLQEEFSWKQVAADTIAGAFGGAAAGLGFAVQAAKSASTALKVWNVVGQTALEISGEAISQTIQYDGRIEQPWALGIAGAGGFFGAIAANGVRTSKVAAQAGRATRGGAGRFGRLNKVIRLGDSGSTLTAMRAKASSIDELARLRAVDDHLLKGTRIARFKAVFKREWNSSIEPMVSFSSKTRSAVKSARESLKIRNVVSSATSAMRKIKSAGQAAVRSVREARLAGTVQKFKNVKVVRSFKYGEDGTRVATYSHQLRKSVAGTSRRARLERFAKNLRSHMPFSNSASVKFSEANGVFTTTRVSGGKSYKITKVDTVSLAGGKLEKTLAPTRYEKIYKNIGTSKFARVKQAFEVGGNRAKRLFNPVIPDSWRAKKVKYVEVDHGTHLERVRQVYDYPKVEVLLETNRRTGRFTSYVDEVAFVTEKYVRRSVDQAGAVTSEVFEMTSRVKQTKSLTKFSSFAAHVYDAYSSTQTGGNRAWKAIKRGAIKFADSAARGFEAKKKSGTLEMKLGQSGSIGSETVAFFYDDSVDQKSLYRAGDAHRGFMTGGLLKEAVKSKVVDMVLKGSKTLKEMAFPSTPQSSSERGSAMSIVSNMGFDFYVNRLESREEKAGVFNTINQAFVPNFADLNGRLTFADQHSRTHSWEAVRWQDVAGDATTQVFSSFANDRADNVATALVSNRMIAGQTQDFTAEALLAFAEASVGAVQGNFANSKVVLTLLETGSPDAMA